MLVKDDETRIGQSTWIWENVFWTQLIYGRVLQGKASQAIKNVTTFFYFITLLAIAMPTTITLAPLLLSLIPLMLLWLVIHTSLTMYKTKMEENLLWTKVIIKKTTQFKIKKKNAKMRKQALKNHIHFAQEKTRS